MTHADAADPFDGDRYAGFIQRPDQGISEFSASSGETAGVQADSDFAAAVASWSVVHTGFWFLESSACFVVQKIVDDVWDGIGGEMAVCHFADLRSRCKGAAAETEYLLDGKKAVGVGVGGGWNVKVSSECFVDLVSALYVAGRADANVNDVAADGTMAELVIEGGDPHDGSRGNLGQLTEVFEGLEDGEDVTRLSTNSLERLVNECQVELFHWLGWPSHAIRG